jgi:hypothetical protein
MAVVVVLIILAFAAAGLDRVLRSVRGRPVPCDPVCARCGYDLRGFTELVRCSECGSDLLVSGAVRRTTQRTSRRGVAGGLALMAVPWGFIGAARWVQYAGPNWERVRTNSSLIGLIGHEEIPRPVLWEELAGRLASGRLSRAEASTALDRLAVYAANQQRAHRMGGLLWSSPFYTAADRAGVISGPQYLAIAQAVYGPTPRVSVHGPMDSEAPASYWTDSEYLGGSLPGAHLVIRVVRAYLTGASATPGDVAGRTAKAGVPPLPSQGVDVLDARPLRLRTPRVPSGDYEAAFVMEMLVLPAAGPTRVTSAPIAGPAPLAQWRSTVRLPVQVHQAYGRGTVDHPPQPPELVVRTDVGADPVMTQSLAVTLAEAWCYPDRTTVSFHLKVDHVPVPCWSKVVVRVAGQYAQSKWPLVIWPQEESDAHSVMVEIGPIGREVTAADLILVPETDRQWGLEQVWGKVVKFEGVALRRHEMRDGGAATTRP